MDYGQRADTVDRQVLDKVFQKLKSKPDNKVSGRGLFRFD